MKLSHANKLSSKIDVLVCPVFEDQKSIQGLSKPKSFKGETGEIERLTGTGKLPNKIVFVGLGKKKKFENPDARNSVAKVVKGSMEKKVNVMGLYLTNETEKFASEMVEGMLLVNRTIANYKTGKGAKKVKEGLFGEAVVVSKNKVKGLDKILSTVEAVNFVRDIVNAPPNVVDVEFMAREAKKIAKDIKASIKVFDKAAIKKMKMGALLCVNQGSGKKGAKLVVMDYKPAGAKGKPILLVGKGLIFDSGGYNLKPTKYIEDMQQDMAGGAVVLGVFKLLKKLNVKKRVIGIVPLTENLVDSEAVKPSDIVTSYSGQTIEIRNTDAEGRLILADALSYGVKKYDPEYTVDLATLTGACIYALGERYAGVMGNDDKLNKKLIEAGNKTDELLWELPMHKDFSESMKGKLGDLRNSDNGTSYMAGTSKAAAFLMAFVEKAKWAHLDIAGTAYVDSPRPINQPMGTGYGVRLLINFLKDL